MIKSNSILFLKGFRNEVDYIAKEKYFKEYLKLLEDDNDESDKNDTERSEVS
jgi:hypothetical protein